MGKAIITVTVMIEVDLDAEVAEYGLAGEDATVVQLMNDLPDMMAHAAIHHPRMTGGVGLRAYTRTSDECEWFANCKHRATALVPHPALGHVPACPKHQKFSGR